MSLGELQMEILVQSRTISENLSFDMLLLKGRAHTHQTEQQLLVQFFAWRHTGKLSPSGLRIKLPERKQSAPAGTKSPEWASLSRSAAREAPQPLRASKLRGDHDR